MNAKSFSINKACIGAALFFFVSSALFLLSLMLAPNTETVLVCGVCYISLTGFSILWFIWFLRRKLVLFSDEICRLLDHMMAGQMQLPQTAEEESLFYKIHHRLIRLYEALQEHKRTIAQERSDLQELISDISHQVKTPASNLKLISATLSDQSMPSSQREAFLASMERQIDKLDFLMQAMVKTSRLETGVISLEQSPQNLYETLAEALGGVFFPAEKKQIQISVSCPDSLILPHDRKWTSEALFNLLDNAVKYTPAGGTIQITADILESYAKISIMDTGKGIPEQHQGKIFQRFYREEDVHDTDGIGIGLYLTREIITLQGGYLKVSSQVNKGSVFSVFLPLRS